MTHHLPRRSLDRQHRLKHHRQLSQQHLTSPRQRRQERSLRQACLRHCDSSRHATTSQRTLHSCECYILHSTCCLRITHTCAHWPLRHCEQRGRYAHSIIRRHTHTYKHTHTHTHTHTKVQCGRACADNVKTPCWHSYSQGYWYARVRRWCGFSDTLCARYTHHSREPPGVRL